MSFRARVTLAAGCAVLVAVLGTSYAVYLLVERDLRARVDESLQSLGRPQLTQGLLERLDRLTNTDGAPLGVFDDRYVQFVDTDGTTLWSLEGRELPVDAAVAGVAGGEPGFYADVTIDGQAVRTYVREAGEGVALQVGQSLAEVEDSLQQLVVTLAVISAVALGIAAVVGRFVAAAAVAPVHRLSAAAEAVARTGDLSQHIPASGRDELARLATSFNTMLDALDASLTRQRELVAGASHELRTPLASVRTNVEVLARADELPPGDLARLRRDVLVQVGELTRLVDDLVELAREGSERESVGTFALDHLVAEVVDSARRRHPRADVRLAARPCAVRGTPPRVARAVANLLDNAVKWSPGGAPIEVTVAGGTVTVCDRGPGIDPVDLPHIFDRFYRSVAARRLPGSGLGLAIVKQVADDHGGHVAVHPRPTGGTRFTLHFPPP